MMLGIIKIIIIIIYVRKDYFVSLSNTLSVVTKELYNLLNVRIITYYILINITNNLVSFY
jgi:hypothetical protein